MHCILSRFSCTSKNILMETVFITSIFSTDVFDRKMRLLSFAKVESLTLGFKFLSALQLHLSKVRNHWSFFLKSQILTFITSLVIVLQFYLTLFEAFICPFYDSYLMKIFKKIRNPL